MSLTNKELGKSISYTQDYLRNTTEDQSETTRGRVLSTHQLVDGLRNDVYNTQGQLTAVSAALL